MITIVLKSYLSSIFHLYVNIAHVSYVSLKIAIRFKLRIFFLSNLSNLISDYDPTAQLLAVEIT